MSTANAQAREEQGAARFAALPVAKQMAMARKLAEQKGDALKKAHAGLVTVAAGYRAQRDASGQALVHPQPCVILGVRHKWHSPQNGTLEQRVPRYLFTHRSFGVKRALYAVPTDVQPMDWFHGAVARNNSSVWVDDPLSHGTLTCAVQVQTQAGKQHFALSAMHVLSPWIEMDAVAPFGAGVHAAGTVGSTQPFSGALRQAADSFDAQLAAISDQPWFNAAFAQSTLPAAQPYVRSADEFDTLMHTQSLMVQAPDNHPEVPGRGPMMAQFRSYVGNDVPITYKVSVGGVRQRMYVRHSVLVQMEVTGSSPAPEPGDSGSAVLTWRLDGTPALAGMFIASLDPPAERVAYMLPAWELFKPGNWAALPPGTTRMTPRFNLP